MTSALGTDSRVEVTRKESLERQGLERLLIWEKNTREFWGRDTVNKINC